MALAIYDMVSAGIPEGDAIALAAERASAPLDQARAAWTQSRRQRAAMDLYARRQTAQAMKKAGYPVSEIARLLSVHEKHVPRLLRD